MPSESPFAASADYCPSETWDHAGRALPARFGTASDEYLRVRSAAGLLDRSDRTIVEITGKDRAVWLHNLVTNAIKDLDPSQGNYAFACDVRGRIQFDMNVLVRDGAIWLDLDAAFVDRALQHFNRYLITEDVKLTPQPDRFARLGICGSAAWDVAQRLGFPHGGALPSLGQFTFEASGVVLVQHDFSGDAGFELLVPPVDAAHWWSRAAEAGAAPAGQATLDVLRIEAGIPWLGRDIDDSTLPAETEQVERAISYHKGCYLGQEVVERMRAYKALARRLVKLSLDDGGGLALPTPMKSGDRDAGRITSLVPHPTRSEWIGLGYLRTQFSADSDLVAGDPPRGVRVLQG